MKIRVSMQSYMDASRGWRLGVATAERVLGGSVTLEDVQGYGPVYHWSNDNGYCTTDCKGNVLSLDLEV